MSLSMTNFMFINPVTWKAATLFT